MVSGPKTCLLSWVSPRCSTSIRHRHGWPTCRALRYRRLAHGSSRMLCRRIEASWLLRTAPLARVRPRHCGRSATTCLRGPWSCCSTATAGVTTSMPGTSGTPRTDSSSRLSMSLRSGAAHRSSFRRRRGSRTRGQPDPRGHDRRQWTIRAEPLLEILLLTVRAATGDAHPYLPRALREYRPTVYAIGRPIPAATPRNQGPPVRSGNRTKKINAPTWTSPIRSTIRSHSSYLFAQVRASLRIVVEVAGIEPASSGTEPGLLRAEPATCFSAPADTQASRRGLSRCLMFHLAPRPGQMVILLATPGPGPEELPG